MPLGVRASGALPAAPDDPALSAMPGPALVACLAARAATSARALQHGFRQLV
eukprot:CAMPEP_0206001118 /NCGR_PEP_ID=MMETSP1464-20131121/1904_1 /ASSEMBLY_ACC=CAM_ASM_001124 /TAXON_ID=119497 /ORGANISM="Exanthemachrysis gayraliae, Strain RCC1523" /LENGTH=51 /DNA_ID=CAMNT_0053374403 /DNA_START=78 /DNA_END=229 /DNA_ORIENTATION=+